MFAGEQLNNDQQDNSWHRKSLKNDGWLSHTTEEFCDALFAHATLTTHEKGDKIFTIGDPSGLTGFASGSGMLTVHFENRDPLRAHIVHPGNWIGAASIIGRCERVTSVAAAQNCSVLTLSLEASDKILQQNPDHWQWFGLLAAQNQSISVRATEALLHRDPTKRLIATILRLIEFATPGSAVVDLAVSQSDLAEMSNLSRGFVSACLADLHAKGIIEKRYGRIAIPGRKQLKAMLMKN